MRSLRASVTGLEIRTERENVAKKAETTDKRDQSGRIRAGEIRRATAGEAEKALGQTITEIKLTSRNSRPGIGESSKKPGEATGMKEAEM